MEKRFPVETVEHKGKEFINIKSDVFHQLFLEIMRHSDIDTAIVNEINKCYKKARKIKKSRIRLKKEKEALIVMYNLMLPSK